jgi:membrane protease YdiL (CAAX protease family)
MFSAFQVLNSEGHALWLLFTLPHRLERIVTEKALLWGGLALIYPCAIFGLAIGFSGNVSLETVGVFTLVLLGVPVYALIAACLGVIGSNPLDQDVQRRVRPRQAYLYMILASLYAYTIYASTHWQRFSLLTLTGLLAFALWQKARDQLPYLLDPVSLPPPRASLADGLIAGQIFFVLQALLALALRGSDLSAGLVTLIAFTVGGGLTYGIMRLYYWKRRVLGVPGLLKGAPAGRSLAAGILFGGLAAAGGLLYLVLVHQTGLLPTRGFETVDVERETLLWIFLLAVVFAPIFEEFIFRGLIFGGLRRSFGLVASVLGSAAVFAVVHPPFSVAPVFLLGVCTALAYEKTRGLLAPILTHAVYNAVLLAARAAGL